METKLTIEKRRILCQQGKYAIDEYRKIRKEAIIMIRKDFKEATKTWNTYTKKSEKRGILVIKSDDKEIRKRE